MLIFDCVGVPNVVIVGVGVGVAFDLGWMDGFECELAWHVYGSSKVSKHVLHCFRCFLPRFNMHWLEAPIV